MQRTPEASDGTVTGRTVPCQGGVAEWGNGLGRRELGDDAAAEQAAVSVVQGSRLPGGDRPHRLGEIEGDRPARIRPHPAGHGRGAVAALHQDRIPRRQRLGEPVHLGERHAVAEQVVPGADHDLARFGADRDHVHRLAEPTGEAAPLPDGIAREARVLSHHRAAGRHQGPRARRRRSGGQQAREHPDVIVARDEADLHRFDLLGGDEAEPAGHVPRFALGERPDGREDPRHDAPVDAPQEVRLVLPWIAPAKQRTVSRDCVMAGGDVGAVERVRVVQEVAELGERVAAHAGDRSAAAGVLGDEVRDHVAAEAVLEIQDVVRDPELVSHEPGVGDRIEGAAGPVGDGVAVAEQLHGGADDVVPRLHQQGCGYGRVDTARHRDEDAIAHRCSTAERARTFSTIFGSAPISVSTSSRVFSLPNENRSAATPSSRGTPIAVSTCDGSTAPVEHAEPDEQAIPARSRCISRASLSVPGLDPHGTPPARSPAPAALTASGTTASSRRSSSSRSAATRAANAACSRAASSTAAPSPTIPGTFSVPGRIPNCWPPPWMIASTAWRSRTTSAPIPLGAAILWPETVKTLHATSCNDTGTLPKACTPSTWNGTPASRHRAASRATGCTTPISLFTHITLTTATPRASASLSPSSATSPWPFTGRMISSPPRRATACAAARTALCSIADTATRNGPPRSRAASAHPITARLSASVPPDVKITWPGSARSEERRVGKECRSRGGGDDEREKESSEKEEHEGG